MMKLNNAKKTKTRLLTIVSIPLPLRVLQVCFFFNFIFLDQFLFFFMSSISGPFYLLFQKKLQYVFLDIST